MFYKCIDRLLKRTTLYLLIIFSYNCAKNNHSLTIRISGNFSCQDVAIKKLWQDTNSPCVPQKTRLFLIELFNTSNQDIEIYTNENLFYHPSIVRTFKKDILYTRSIVESFDSEDKLTIKQGTRDTLMMYSENSLTTINVIEFDFLYHIKKREEIIRVTCNVNNGEIVNCSSVLVK